MGAVVSRFSVEEDYLCANSGTDKPVSTRSDQLLSSGFRSSIKGIANLS
jgi:hypothetical protein